VDRLTLDIETVPAQRPDILAHIEESLRDDLAAALSEVKAPANYKDEEKITEFVCQKRGSIKAEFDAKLAEKIHATGLDGAFGQVLCIGWAWNDGPIRTAYSTSLTGAGEHDTILEFFLDMPVGFRKACVIGHNVSAFDLRFLKQRAMVLGIRPPLSIPFDAKPWDEAIFDTMVQFAGVGKTISLDKLCRAFGIDGKGAISGADVWPMAQAGRFKEIADYCADDVRKTREVWRRMTFADIGAAA